MGMIEAQAVTVRLSQATLLAGVDLAIAAGETVAIVGPNGAGKSTLLRVLAGEIVPTDGGVRLKDQALGSYSPARLAGHRSVLSQSLGVVFPFTVDEIVRMGAGDAHGRAVDALVEAALAEVDLVRLRHRVITTLSGGEQHRAHFARVLVQLARGEAANGPGLLLLDEPTASLDLRHQTDFLAITQTRAKAGTAVIAVLHDLNLAAAFANRIVVLHRGAVVADGPPAAVIQADLLGRVFDVTLRTAALPPGTACVLPHMIAPRPRPAVVAPPPAGGVR